MLYLIQVKRLTNKNRMVEKMENTIKATKEIAKMSNERRKEFYQVLTERHGERVTKNVKALVSIVDMFKK